MTKIFFIIFVIGALVTYSADRTGAQMMFCTGVICCMVYLIGEAIMDEINSKQDDTGE